MDKYYFKKTSSISSRNWAFLMRYNPVFYLEIEENTDMPSISLYTDKLDLGNLRRPQGTKYEKVKEITKETFDDFFKAAIKSLRQTKWDSAEYFLVQDSKGHINLAMFTNGTSKLHINIEIWDSLESLSVDLHCGRSYSYRPRYRKNAVVISEEIFVKVLKTTIKFIEEQESYGINSEEYVKNIKGILTGDIPVEIPDETINVEQLITQLESRKNELTARLIENDSDTESQRASLRGEKEGAEYSLRAIRKYFRLIS